MNIIACRVKTKIEINKTKVHACMNECSRQTVLIKRRKTIADF